MKRALISFLAMVSITASAEAQPVDVTLIAQTGQMPAPATAPIRFVYSPFTNGNGAVGFIGQMTNGDWFVWRDTGIVWQNTDSMMPTFTSVDTTAMGIADAMGTFLYLPRDTLFDEYVYSNSGILIRELDPLPGGGPTDRALRFSTPRMLPAGGIAFIADIDTDTDTGTEGRGLYFTGTGAIAGLTRLYGTGDSIGSFTLDLFAVNSNDWDVSDDGMRRIAHVDLVTGGFVDDAAIVVNSMVVAQESTPSVGSMVMDNWDNFDLTDINDSGNYLFSGDTDGPTTTDEFLAYNGSIVFREGDTVGGNTLGGTVGAGSLNNDDQAVFVWNEPGTGDETLYGVCDAANFARTTTVLLSENDMVDVDADGMADAQVTDFNAFNTLTGLDLAEDGDVYVEVDLNYGIGDLEAIIRVPLDCCGDGLVRGGETCDDSGESATCDVDCTAVMCGDGVTNTTAMETCDDGGESMTCDTDCTAAMCGDSTVNATAGEQCDDGMESATCDVDCTMTSCGDMTVNMTAGEACDDGMESATCDADCTMVACGDMTVNVTAGEVCDDGMATATCDEDCTEVECGDGSANAAAGEACDDGMESATCNTDCTAATCGDNIVNRTAGEVCDDGMATATCNADCTSTQCGDGTVNTESGEDCDDGMETATCDENCTTATCGDNTVNAAAGEECDTGAESASCDADCTVASCGDGTANTAAGEECDDGGASATCDADCSAPACGDGILNTAAGEECEDGNTDEGDGCDATCVREIPVSDEGGCCAVFGPRGSDDTRLAVLGMVFGLLVASRVRRRRRRG